MHNKDTKLLPSFTFLFFLIFFNFSPTAIEIKSAKVISAIYKREVKLRLHTVYATYISKDVFYHPARASNHCKSMYTSSTQFHRATECQDEEGSCFIMLLDELAHRKEEFLSRFVVPGVPSSAGSYQLMMRLRSRNQPFKQ